VKRTLIAASAAVLVMAVGPAFAADKGETLVKDLDCLKCHAITSKKKGPAFKTTTAQWKGAGLSVDKAVASMKDKHDGDLKGKDDELKAIATWILSL
jgi:cytochrome c551/c552